MKKVNKGLQFVAALILILSSVTLVAAAEGDSSYELYEKAENGILSEFESILPEGFAGLTESGEAISMLGFDALMSEALTSVSENIGRVAVFLALLLGVSAVISLSGLIDGENAALVRGGVALVAGISVIAALFPLVREVGQVLTELGGFFSSLAPVLVSVLALGGGTASAAVSGTGMALVLRVYGGLCELLVPLVSAMLVLGVSSSFITDGFGSAYDTVRGWFARGVGILTALIGGTVALQGVVATSSDSAALRVARHIATGTVPVVGAAVSGALSTLSGGLGYISGIVGGGAVAVILTMGISPLIMLLLYKLCFFFASLMLDYFGAGEGKRTVLSIGSALDSLIAVYAMSVIVYLLETVIFIGMAVRLV